MQREDVTLCDCVGLDGDDTPQEVASEVYRDGKENRGVCPNGGIVKDTCECPDKPRKLLRGSRAKQRG